MSDAPPSPEVQFSNDLKAATRICPAITAFVDTLNSTELSQMERLNRVASIAYRLGGMKEPHLTELVRVWMIHDAAACHRFLMSEDRIRVEKRVNALDKSNREKGALVDTLQKRVQELESELYTQSQIKLQEDRAAANVCGSQATCDGTVNCLGSQATCDDSPVLTQKMEEDGQVKRRRW